MKMKLIDGNGAKTAQRIADKREAIAYTYLKIMATEKDPGKVFHAGVRWFSMRDRQHLDPEAEFKIHNMLLEILALNFSPEWIAREFPAEKEYKGHKWECKDYFSCMDALANSSSFNGDTAKVLEFLWDWHNWTLNKFTLAGLSIADDIRAMAGEPSCFEQFATENGITTYHTAKTEDGKTIVIDDKGRVTGRIRKHIPRYLKVVK